jgi:tRNA pseudouridine65 synthase
MPRLLHAWLQQQVEGPARSRELSVVDKPRRADGARQQAGALARADFAADHLRAQFGRPIFLQVHRLDRATSGCLLLAFDHDTAHRVACYGAARPRALMAHDQGKDYLAGDGARLARAATSASTTRSTAGRASRRRSRRPPLRGLLATRRTRRAVGGFPTSRFALLRARRETGRFRQIRRHLKHAGTTWSATPATATAATTGMLPHAARHRTACCCTPRRAGPVRRHS